RHLNWIGLGLLIVAGLLAVLGFLIPFAWLLLLALPLGFLGLILLSHDWQVILQPFAVLALVLLVLSSTTNPHWLPFLLNLVVFFVVALVCHGELARDRPPTRHLTEFYLWMSVGGVVGGMFNALLAPVLFVRVIEYTLALVLACLLRPPT